MLVLLPPLLLALIASVAQGQEPGHVAQFLDDISVTIGAGKSEGSGVLKNRDGVTYVWTAAHVVSELRSLRDIVDPKTGTKRTIVEFQDATVMKQLVEDGRTVGKVQFDAEVLRYSNAETGHDLALLRVRKKNFFHSSAQFYLEDNIPPVGTELYHVGSLLGQFGANSLTTGVLSRVGRVLEGNVYDQTTVDAFPGSSGGGVYLKDDGRYVGMLVRGTNGGFHLVVPIRRMREWANTAEVAWALDDTVPMPSDAELKKLPIEDVGASFSSESKPKNTSQFHFMIRPVDETTRAFFQARTYFP